MPQPKDNGPTRTMLLTGASRGIGHATVKRFSAAGWRVITCSRHPFPENCPWEMGPEDHIQVDLANPVSTEAAILEIPTASKMAVSTPSSTMPVFRRKARAAAASAPSKHPSRTGSPSSKSISSRPSCWPAVCSTS